MHFKASESKHQICYNGYFMVGMSEVINDNSQRTRIFQQHQYSDSLALGWLQLL